MFTLLSCGLNNCWVSPVPWHSSHGEAGKLGPSPGNMGTHREMRGSDSGRGGNLRRAPSFWPNVLTLSTGSEKLQLKTDFKWKQWFLPHFTQSGRHSQNFQTPLGEANLLIYCLKIVIRLRHKDRKQAVRPFQDCALKLIVSFWKAYKEKTTRKRLWVTSWGSK